MTKDSGQSSFSLQSSQHIPLKLAKEKMEESVVVFFDDNSFYCFRRVRGNAF